jgi:hypothetical protein
MIPPQVNGATSTKEQILAIEAAIEFPMIPPQVNGATSTILRRLDAFLCFQ